jgi:hypothetical protein
MPNYSALGGNFAQRAVKYIEFPMNPKNINSKNKKTGKLLPSYRITFRFLTNYAANNRNAQDPVTFRGGHLGYVNTPAKIAQYITRRKMQGPVSKRPVSFLFKNVYPHLYTITRVVNENGSFPNNHFLSKVVQKLSTSGGIKGFIRSELINANNGNAKRRQILSNFLTRYASNKRV